MENKLIFSNEYLAPENGYYNIETQKKQIVIGFSLRSEDNHIMRFYNKSFDNERQWSTFSISRSGKIYQHFNPNYYSDFLIKKKESNPNIISIVLSNMGVVYKDNDIYKNRLIELCDAENVLNKKVGDLEYWEKIPTKQFNSLVKLCIYLCEEYNIKRKSIDFEFVHKNIDSFNGIVFKSNYVSDNIEINQAFDLKKFIKLINEEDE